MTDGTLIDDDSEIVASGVAENRKYKVVHNKKLGHFCGYVQTNFRPPWGYGEIRGYMSNLVGCHGGLTYGVDEQGYVGFDCAHAGDVCVLDGETVSDHEMSTRQEWTVEDVEAECRKVARQIDTLETFAEKFQERSWGDL